MRQLTDLMTRAVRSFGNWSMYFLAIGWDESSRVWNRCGSSLNSRNFHFANGVYVRPPIEDGFLWYSCATCHRRDWFSHARKGSQIGRRERTDLEVAEERIHEQVEDDERRKDGVDDRHKDETSPKSARECEPTFVSRVECGSVRIDALTLQRERSCSSP